MIVLNRADYLGQGQADVGQRVADDKLELFVAVEPAKAMQQQFAALQPEYIALHDIGASQSLRLLGAVAKALKTRVQTLSIRRQGHGVALAVVPFVELPGRGDKRLRVYSTDVDTDAQARRQLCTVLLGHARLGVLLVSEIPAIKLSAALQPVREAVNSDSALPTRELLMVPMGTPGALAEHAAAMDGPAGFQVHVTAQAKSPNEAWGFITAAWNRLRKPSSAPQGTAELPAAAPASRAVSPTTEAPLTPVAAVATPDAAPRTEAGRWSAYLQACKVIQGLVRACILDTRGGHPLAYEGSTTEAALLAGEGLKLCTAMVECGRGLGLGHAVERRAVLAPLHALVDVQGEVVGILALGVVVRRGGRRRGRGRPRAGQGRGAGPQVLSHGPARAP